MSDSNKILRPSAHCVSCERSLGDFGGKRITAQTPRGYALIDKPRTGGNNDPKYTNIEIDDNQFLCVWGEVWSPEAIQRAVKTIKDGELPWFCQFCGQRLCFHCAYPLNLPMGSDILCDDGTNPHYAVLPFNSACCNSKCQNYRRMP